MPSKYPNLIFNKGVDWKDVNPTLLARVNRLAGSLGEKITVISGYRSREQQAHLYQIYVNSGYSINHIAAKPGTSNHERGMAVDLLINGVPIANRVSATMMQKFGLVNPVHGDNPHTELAGGGKSASVPTTTQKPTAHQAPATPQMADMSSVPEVAPAPGGPADPTMAQAFDPGTRGSIYPQSNQILQNWQAIASDPVAPSSAQYWIDNAKLAGG